MLKTKDDRTNQEVSINKNCAEMDRQVPLLMGVSNAILENVIFCHQEDTLWPFSDQANLKKIFDEIFDTSKYTKALTEMRNSGKKYTKYMKDFKQQLDLKKKDYEQYIKLKQSIVQFENKIKELKDQNLIKKERYEKLAEELREFQKQEDEFNKLKYDIHFWKIVLEDKR